MIRRIVPMILVAAVALAGLVIAQEPDPGDGPVRLKKKDRNQDMLPKDELKKPDLQEPGKEDPDKTKEGMKDPPAEGKEANQPAEDPAEVLARIDRNLKNVVDRLQNNELNDGTRQRQDDVLKDLESLINQNENPPPPQGNGGAGSKSNPGQNKPPPNRGGTKTASRPKPQPGSSGSRPMGSSSMPNAGQGVQRSGNMTPGSQSNPDKANPPNVDDGTWGNLPQVIRAQMNAYQTRKGYSQRNSDLVDSYRRALTSPGKDQGD